MNYLVQVDRNGINKSLKLPIDIYGTGKELEFCQNYAEKIGISKNNLARLDSRFMG